MKTEKKLSDPKEKARLRKRRSREQAAERRKALGLARVEIDLSQKARDALTRLKVARGPEGDPYTDGEYISELILLDEQRYQEQVAKLGCCGKCKSPLPEGCGGVFDGDSECWRTYKKKELML